MMAEIFPGHGVVISKKLPIKWNNWKLKHRRPLWNSGARFLIKTYSKPYTKWKTYLRNFKQDQSRKFVSSYILLYYNAHYVIRIYSQIHWLKHFFHNIEQNPNFHMEICPVYWDSLALSKENMPRQTRPKRRRKKHLLCAGLAGKTTRRSAGQPASGTLARPIPALAGGGELRHVPSHHAEEGREWKDWPRARSFKVGGRWKKKRENLEEEGRAGTKALYLSRLQLGLVA